MPPVPFQRGDVPFALASALLLVMFAFRVVLPGPGVRRWGAAAFSALVLLVHAERVYAVTPWLAAQALEARGVRVLGSQAGRVWFALLGLVEHPGAALVRGVGLGLVVLGVLWASVATAPPGVAPRWAVGSALARTAETARWRALVVVAVGLVMRWPSPLAVAGFVGLAGVLHVLHGRAVASA